MGQDRNSHVAAALLVALFVAGIGAIWAAWAFVGEPAERPVASSAVGPLADPDVVYDPVRANEALPKGFRQLLGRDQILPVYDPVFTERGAVDWPVDSLVIGVAGETTAKAFPITHLNQREMVIDSLEGIPILVTW